MSSVEGLDELLATLSGLGGDMKRTLRLGIGQAGERIKAQAKRNAPSKTGNLRNSIHSFTKVNGDEIVGKVYTNCEYAVYVNYGTGSKGAENDLNGKKIYHTAKEKWTYTNDGGKTFYTTKGQAPQPFMDSAYLYGKNNNILEKQVKKIVQQEIRKLGGKK